MDARFYWPDFEGRIRYDTSHWQDNRLMGVAHAFTQKVSPSVDLDFFTVGKRDYAEYGPFDLRSLQAIVGNDPVVLPLSTPLPVQEALKRSGQFVPTFYDCAWSVLDSSAEDRQLKELNASRWALIPHGARVMWTETPAGIAQYLGQSLPYAMKHEPYVIGRRFAENLKANWQSYGEVGRFEVYRRRN